MKKNKGMILYGGFIVAFLAFVTLISVGCGAVPSSSNIQLSGLVMGIDGDPIAGALIELDGASITTDASGEFSQNIVFTERPERVYYMITRDGYFNFEGGIRPSPNGEAYIKIALNEAVVLGTVDAASGGEVSNSELIMDFPTDSFTDGDGNAIDGDVTVKAGYISPDDPNFTYAMPGGDFQAQDSSGTEGSLTSFGAFNMALEDESGDDVNLANTIEIRVLIPASLQASAPASMAVWMLNRGIWVEGATAVKSGSFYVFTIDESVGAINCDLFSRNAIVEGTVFDVGTPVPDTEVTIGQLSVFTDGSGEYAALVPADVDLDFQALPYGTVTKDAGELDIDKVNVVDIGIQSVPSLGSGTFTFGGRTISGVAVGSDTMNTWGITDTTNFDTLSITGVLEEDGTKTVAEGVFAALALSTGSQSYYSDSGSVTRSDTTLSFEFNMVNAITSLSEGTLSGVMTATLVD